MTIHSRTTVKSYFETGDKPTQAEFANFIDSALFYEDTSDFGRSLISASAAVSARTLLGINTPGTVGNILLTATTTASALNQLGGTTLGKSLFEAVTTASAQNQLAVPTTAAKSDQEAAITGVKYTSPSTQQYHPSATKVWIRVVNAGTPANFASYNVSSLTDVGTGRVTVNFTTNFTTAGEYCSLASVEQSDSIVQTLGDGNKNVGSEEVRITNLSGTLIDANFNYVAFGGQ
jgi:hypothetical protein